LARYRTPARAPCIFSVRRYVSPCLGIQGSAGFLHGTTAGSTSSPLGHNRQLCGCLPARPDRQRLLSGSCSSARGFAPRFLPTIGHPHAVALRPLCSTRGRTCTRKNAPMPGAQTKKAEPLDAAFAFSQAFLKPPRIPACNATPLRPSPLCGPGIVQLRGDPRLASRRRGSKHGSRRRVCPP
jgi:hypothetical protein